MSRKEKLLKKIQSKPKDFTYEEAKTLLLQLGFEEDKKRQNFWFTCKFY